MKTTYDFERIWESKRALRQRLAAAPVIEKLRMLDALHERAAAIRGARFRETTAVQPSGGGCGGCSPLSWKHTAGGNSAADERSPGAD